MTGPDAAPSPTATPAKAVTSVILVAVFSAIYLVGLVELCRQSLLVEAGISLALPVFCAATGWFRYQHPRLIQLLVIESFYNLMVVGGKLSIALDMHTANRAVALGFGVFFVLQLGAFVAFQLKRRSLHGVVQSLTAVLLIGYWWMGLSEVSNTVDADGRFLMWGADAPLAIRLYYVIWVVNVLLVDSPIMPWLRTATAHFVSVGLALWSGEFFHVRVLTACNLFVLDLVLGFGMGAPEALGRDFAVVPTRWLPAFRRTVQPLLGWACTLGCLALLVGVAIGGLDLWQ
jgi:hypothetical protein